MVLEANLCLFLSQIQTRDFLHYHVAYFSSFNDITYFIIIDFPFPVGQVMFPTSELYNSRFYNHYFLWINVGYCIYLLTQPRGIFLSKKTKIRSVQAQRSFRSLYHISESEATAVISLFSWAILRLETANLRDFYCITFRSRRLSLISASCSCSFTICYVML